MWSKNQAFHTNFTFWYICNILKSTWHNNRLKFSKQNTKFSFFVTWKTFNKLLPKTIHEKIYFDYWFFLVYFEMKIIDFSFSSTEDTPCLFSSNHDIGLEIQRCHQGRRSTSKIAACWQDILYSLWKLRAKSRKVP